MAHVLLHNDLNVVKQSDDIEIRLRSSVVPILSIQRAVGVGPHVSAPIYCLHVDYCKQMYQYLEYNQVHGKTNANLVGLNLPIDDKYNSMIVESFTRESQDFVIVLGETCQLKSRMIYNVYDTQRDVWSFNYEESMSKGKIFNGMDNMHRNTKLFVCDKLLINFGSNIYSQSYLEFYNLSNVYDPLYVCSKELQATDYSYFIAIKLVDCVKVTDNIIDCDILLFVKYQQFANAIRELKFSVDLRKKKIHYYEERQIQLSFNSHYGQMVAKNELINVNIQRIFTPDNDIKFMIIGALFPRQCRFPGRYRRFHVKQSKRDRIYVYNHSTHELTIKEKVCIVTK